MAQDRIPNRWPALTINALGKDFFSGHRAGLSMPFSKLPNGSKDR